jgi:hypothetical protein
LHGRGRGREARRHRGRHRHGGSRLTARPAPTKDQHGDARTQREQPMPGQPSWHPADRISWGRAAQGAAAGTMLSTRAARISRHTAAGPPGCTHPIAEAERRVTTVQPPSHTCPQGLSILEHWGLRLRGNPLRRSRCCGAAVPARHNACGEGTRRRRQSGRPGTAVRKEMPVKVCRSHCTIGSLRPRIYKPSTAPLVHSDVVLVSRRCPWPGDTTRRQAR